MAIIFVDGFDYYPTADIAKKWSSTNFDGNNNGPSIVQQGRYGTNTGAVQMGSTGNAGLSKTTNNFATIVMGFAFRSTSPNPGPLVTLYSQNTTQAILSLNSGTLNYCNQPRNSVSINSNVAIIPNTWYYVEFKTTLSSSCTASTTQVRLNGVVVIDVPAGTNTIGDLFYNYNYVAGFKLCGSGQNLGVYPTALIDDFYLCDGTGTVNNDFLGDIRIETLFPNGAGDSTQFTPSSGANWACVSETPEDGDSSYVAGNIPALLDLYTLGDLSSNPTSVHGVQISTIARKTDVGNRILSPVLKSGGNNYDHSGSNPYGLADGYTQHLDIWESNPNGNSPWTGASINALQLGVKVVG